ncbi:hypothetical protein G3N57_00825 [Paraburkholderia sp. Se-20369]|nr:hypothetical protein [Paraburkholderia sp. Se-20369]
MLNWLTEVFASLRALCITLQQNPAGAVCLVALAALALVAYALYVVSTR